MASDRLEALKAALIADPANAGPILQTWAADPGPAAVAEHRPDIDRLFDGTSVEAIVQALAADPSDWAQAQAGVPSRRPR